MLDAIIKNKELEVANLKATTDYNIDQFVNNKNNGNIFLSRLKGVSNNGHNAIIAEIKRQSPSKGVLDPKLNKLRPGHVIGHSGYSTFVCLPA